MNDQIPRFLVVGLDCFRVAFTILRASPILWIFGGWLIVIGVFGVIGAISASIQWSLLLGGVLLTVGHLIWQASDFLISRREFMDYLVKSADCWEPMRVVLFQPHEQSYHPYYQRSLEEKIIHLHTVSNRFPSKTVAFHSPGFFSFRISRCHGTAFLSILVKTSSHPGSTVGEYCSTWR